MSVCHICRNPVSVTNYCRDCQSKYASMRERAAVMNTEERVSEVEKLAQGCGQASANEILWATALSGREIGNVHDADLYVPGYLRLMREAVDLGAPPPRRAA